MHTLVIWLLRLAIVFVLVVSVLLQVGAPIYAADVGRWASEIEHLVIPYSVAAILFIACGQVALIAIWRLLSLVTSGVIFTARALRWVDVITGSGVVALVGVTDGKAAITVAATPDMAGKVNAADLARDAVIAMGGKGAGGKPDFAQGGAPDGSKAEDGLNAIRAALKG